MKKTEIYKCTCDYCGKEFINECEELNYQERYKINSQCEKHEKICKEELFKKLKDEMQFTIEEVPCCGGCKYFRLDYGIEDKKNCGFYRGKYGFDFPVKEGNCCNKYEKYLGKVEI